MFRWIIFALCAAGAVFPPLVKSDPESYDSAINLDIRGVGEIHTMRSESTNSHEQVNDNDKFFSLLHLRHPRDEGISNACHFLGSFQRVYCEIALQVMSLNTTLTSDQRMITLARLQEDMNGHPNDIKVDFQTRTASTLSFITADTPPGTHRSVGCTRCSYARGNITGFDHDKLISELPHSPMHTEHKWERFLLNAGLKPRMHFSWNVERKYGETCDRRISRPTFIFHMMGWHVGHFLVDTLEALYYAHIARFGHVNRDTLLFIDISEKDGMQPYTTSLLARDAFDGDTPFRLLRSFTRHPILSKTALDRLPGVTCFDDLQAELDLSAVFTTKGLQRHPSLARPFLDGGDSTFARRYRKFAHFVERELGLSNPHPHAHLKTMTLVSRRGVRSLENEDAIAALGQASNFSVVTARLENMPFSEQLQLFRKTDVYVCQQGTALHNVLFMRPGSVIMMIMQPDWCDWRWKFADQALYLGMHVLAYCSHSNRFSSVPFAHAPHLDILNVSGSYRWNQRAWLEGPWYSKNYDRALTSLYFRVCLSSPEIYLEQLQLKCTIRTFPLQKLQVE